MNIRDVFLLIPVTIALGQESSSTLVNPFTSEADIARGERTFQSQCASCHGRDGRGGNAGPDLSTGTFKRTSSDEGLFQIINKGVPGTVMPAFPLNPGPAWQVVAYIRSLSIGRRNQGGTGDATRGEQIFVAQKCAGCHESSAPDLDGIGARRTTAEIRESIVNPQADVPSQYWRFKARTRDGRTLAGLRLNEDTYSIQYRDGGGNLRSVLRSQLASFELDRTSPMPSVKDKLNAAEIDDLLAYLVARGVR